MFSTPLYTSKHFIHYPNGYSDKTISQEDSEEILFFKRSTFSQQTVLTTHVVSGKVFVT
jgi:hypothetical protein